MDGEMKKGKGGVKHSACEAGVGSGLSSCDSFHEASNRKLGLDTKKGHRAQVPQQDHSAVTVAGRGTFKWH